MTSSRKKTWQYLRQIISVVLLLCIFIENVPSTIFHTDHHNNCDKENLKLESDPCHITVYHNLVSTKGCDHKKHIDNKTVECKLCKYLNTAHSTFVVSYNDFDFYTSLVYLNSLREADHLLKATPGSDLNKGPPALLHFC
jgi:hypothetical protein